MHIHDILVNADVMVEKNHSSYGGSTNTEIALLP